MHSSGAHGGAPSQAIHNTARCCITQTASSTTSTVLCAHCHPVAHSDLLQEIDNALLTSFGAAKNPAATAAPRPISGGQPYSQQQRLSFRIWAQEPAQRAKTPVPPLPLHQAAVHHSSNTDVSSNDDIASQVGNLIDRTNTMLTTTTKHSINPRMTTLSCVTPRRTTTMTTHLSPSTTASSQWWGDASASTPHDVSTDGCMRNSASILQSKNTAASLVVGDAVGSHSTGSVQTHHRHPLPTIIHHHTAASPLTQPSRPCTARSTTRTPASVSFQTPFATPVALPQSLPQQQQQQHHQQQHQQPPSSPRALRARWARCGLSVSGGMTGRVPGRGGAGVQPSGRCGLMCNHRVV